MRFSTDFVAVRADGTPESGEAVGLFLARLLDHPLRRDAARHADDKDVLRAMLRASFAICERAPCSSKASSS